MFTIKLRIIVKWLLVITFLYFFSTILYFGYSQVDEKKGVYTFYWSGLQALFNDQEFGIVKNKSLDTNFDGLDGPYVINKVVYQVSEKAQLSKSYLINKGIYRKAISTRF